MKGYVKVAIDRMKPHASYVVEFYKSEEEAVKAMREEVKEDIEYGYIDDGTDPEKMSFDELAEECYPILQDNEYSYDALMEVEY